jgi:hypothetical protein
MSRSIYLQTDPTPNPQVSLLQPFMFKLRAVSIEALAASIDALNLSSLLFWDLALLTSDKLLFLDARNFFVS